MPTIVCPSCGQVAQFDALRRAADEFCTNCDFPLFWARADQPLLAGDDRGDASRRRLPGSAGRLVASSKVCPECGELNPMDVRYCIRCSNDFEPPPPPPEPEPEPEPVVVELPPPLPPPPMPVEPEVDRSFWWILAMVAAAIIMIVIVA